MSERPTHYYEAMFVFGQAASADLLGTVSHVRDILHKEGAEILAIKKWGERHLAYPIAKQKRGLFILVYFSAATPALAGIERGCNLSEQILRHLIIRADHLTADEMKAADAQQDIEIEGKLRDLSQPQQRPARPQPATIPPADEEVFEIPSDEE